MANIRNDPSQLRVAMLAVIDGGDALVRVAARAAARVDDARARAQARDLQRMAAKPRVTAATVATIRDRLQATRREAADSDALAARSFVEPVRPSADSGTLHGRVVTSRRAGRPDLEVRAVAVDGKVVAETRTDVHGYFRLDLPTEKAGTCTVRVTVLRGQAVVHQDAAASQVRLGRHRYREIVVSR